ncbi:hypothetical protein PACTADRAFT_16076 [Pachysolen tannophilus NRRL Y-2460]|uniref:Serine/threonine-protein phosphatase 2A activator n=1 Tax=Pachysolen tannophilus NRRL Y-2460 TaxID=669874 RepID=A0A1E4TVX6_PACTA|nr:hypothetical protein PACTADRAFT_16076 [Pachysolen tannophilus NRRL Y-2460]
MTSIVTEEKQFSFPRLKTEGSLDRIEDWCVPVKQIYNQQDVGNFEKSVAIHNIKSCIFKICQLISKCEVPKGVLDDELVSFEDGHKKNGHKNGSGGTGASRGGGLNLPPPVSNQEDGNGGNGSGSKDATGSSDFSKNLKPEVKAVLDLIARLNQLIVETPILPGPRRYGNMAFRSWHDSLSEKIEGFFHNHLKIFYKYNNFDLFITELTHYFIGSFGSRQRLDFGTGHELSFLAFINALLMVDILNRDTITGVDILIIFAKYYDLVKRLILTYTLEPAGSHGVWGLDDHFHLIYILGACQFIDFTSMEENNTTTAATTTKTNTSTHEYYQHHPFPHHRNKIPSPSSILNPMALHKFRTSNLYFNSISFIRKVKTGPFNEHSPILYDISAVKTWDKVTKGMIKMYFVEVLSKFPVVQHFYFGNVLYPWKDFETGKPLPASTEASRDNLKEGDIELEEQMKEKEKSERLEKIKKASTGIVSRNEINIHKPPPPVFGTESQRVRGGGGAQYKRVSGNNDNVAVTKAPWAK